MKNNTTSYTALNSRQQGAKVPFGLATKSKTVTGLGLCGKFNRLENHKFISSLDFLVYLFILLNRSDITRQ